MTTPTSRSQTSDTQEKTNNLDRARYWVEIAESIQGESDPYRRSSMVEDAVIELLSDRAIDEMAGR